MEYNNEELDESREGFSIAPEVLASLDDKLIDRGNEEFPDLDDGDPNGSYFEGLFPKRQLHLIGGPSGSGKTTLVFQMYQALTSLPGGPYSTFLGRKTEPVAWAYVSGDRTARSCMDTQKRVGVSFPVFSLVDQMLVSKDLKMDVLPRLTKFYGYRPNFVYVDGFTSLCPGGKINEYHIVAHWLADLQRFCETKAITILGACHTTKTKEGNGFTNPRQKVLGTVAWASYSESMVIIEPDDKDKSASRRTVMLLPRNGGTETVMMRFSDSGRLVPATEDAVQTETFLLQGLLNELDIKDGEEIYYLRIWAKAKDKGVSRRTFDRWLGKAVKDGNIKRVKKGVYIKA